MTKLYNGHKDVCMSLYGCPFCTCGKVPRVKFMQRLFDWLAPKQKGRYLLLSRTYPHRRKTVTFLSRQYVEEECIRDLRDEFRTTDTTGWVIETEWYDPADEFGATPDPEDTITFTVKLKPPHA